MTDSALTLKIASEIATLVSIGDLAADSHLSTQRLADRFNVSRSPVRQALEKLAARGVLEQRANRGFFVREDAIKNSPGLRKKDRDIAIPSDADDPYYRLAEDLLRDQLPAEATEQFLRDRYELTKSQLADTLNRATNEGWVERKPGYGWRFLPVVRTAESLEQVYRFRSVIEPAALMEPTFVPRRDILTELKRGQESMLGGDIERLPVDRLLLVNMDFHEQLAALSGNPYFSQALVRVNRLRRLLEYRSMIDRQRLFQQCREHLEILELVSSGENLEASALMRRHLSGAIARKSPIHRQSITTSIARKK
jgi:DNA-binding GntR family transcriptional regulator